MLMRCTTKSGGPVLIDFNAIVSVSEASGGGTLIRTIDARSWIVSDVVATITDAVESYWGAPVIDVGAVTTLTTKRKKGVK